MNKSKIIDFAIIILLYVGIAAFPVNLLTANIAVQFIIQIFLLILLIVFLFFFLKNKPYIDENSKGFDLKNFLLLSPIFLVCFSNYFYALIFKENITLTFGWTDLLEIVSIILIVVIEEIIFRYLLLTNIETKNPIVKIVISSAIFGLCHLTVFLSTFEPVNLIVVLYSFGIGMILGILYYYTHRLVVCISIHFAFNLFNDFFFLRLFNVSNNLWFYLTNGIIALLIGSYLVVVYFLKLRKE